MTDETEKPRKGTGISESLKNATKEEWAESGNVMHLRTTDFPGWRKKHPSRNKPITHGPAVRCSGRRKKRPLRPTDRAFVSGHRNKAGLRRIVDTQWLDMASGKGQ